MNKIRIHRIPGPIQSQRKNNQKIIAVRLNKIQSLETLVMTGIGNAEMSVTGLASKIAINVEMTDRSVASVITTDGGKLSGQTGNVKARMNGSSASGMSEKISSVKIAA